MDVIALRRRHVDGTARKEFAPKEYETLIAGVVETLWPFDQQFGIKHIARAVSRWSALRAQSRPSREWTCACRVTTGLALTGTGLVSRQSNGSADFCPVNLTRNAQLIPASSKRADLVVAGCAVLEAVCQIYRQASCVSQIEVCEKAS